MLLQIGFRMDLENRLPSDTWIDCSKILDYNANWLKVKQYYIIEIARMEFALISTHLRENSCSLGDDQGNGREFRASDANLDAS
jgi:hypothetical protein